MYISFSEIETYSIHTGLNICVFDKKIRRLMININRVKYYYRTWDRMQYIKSKINVIKRMLHPNSIWININNFQKTYIYHNKTLNCFSNICFKCDNIKFVVDILNLGARSMPLTLVFRLRLPYLCCVINCFNNPFFFFSESVLISLHSSRNNLIIAKFLQKWFNFSQNN